jgi:hypothetical protein
MEQGQQQQEAGAPGSQRVPLVWTQERVATADGTTVLDSISASFSQSAQRAADGGLLVSLASPSGATSIVDVALGKVRWPRRPARVISGPGAGRSSGPGRPRPAAPAPPGRPRRPARRRRPTPLRARCAASGTWRWRATSCGG